MAHAGGFGAGDTGRAWLNRTDFHGGVLAWIEPEVAAVNAMKAALNAMLPGVMPRAIFGQTDDPVAVADAQRVDIGTQPWAGVVLEDVPAKADVINKEAVVGKAEPPAWGVGH